MDQATIEKSFNLIAQVCRKAKLTLAKHDECQMALGIVRAALREHVVCSQRKNNEEQKAPEAMAETRKESRKKEKA